MDVTGLILGFFRVFFTGAPPWSQRTSRYATNLACSNGPLHPGRLKQLEDSTHNPSD